MRVLIIGGTGMLGHKLYQVFSASTFDVVATIRSDFSHVRQYGFFKEPTIVTGIDALDITTLKTTVDRVKPAVIVNCIGIIKQLKEASERLPSIRINSLLPHKLYDICHQRGIYLIHISTDCVFSGERGNYREVDSCDADDIYGRTKYLGEVEGEGALTIRTSFIGRELETKFGLAEWLISNRNGTVDGYSRTIYSGFTTACFARILTDIILNYQDLRGVYHISSEPISKFRLLGMLNEYMKLGITINENADFVCDRSLDSTLYRQKTGFRPPEWEDMIKEFAEDAELYEQ